MKIIEIWLAFENPADFASALRDIADQIDAGEREGFADQWNFNELDSDEEE